MQFTGSSLAPEEVASCETALQYFCSLFSEEMINEIADQSALNSTQQKPDKPVKISPSDIKQFIGICLYMYLVKLSCARSYWSNEFRVAAVADVMTLNRFEEIKRSLHFSDNARMWANAQRDGRPAEHRWRPLFHAAKFG